MSSHKYHTNLGFTLPELLSVMAIIAITLAIGVPSFKSVMVGSRLTASANDMVMALQLARAEAIKQVKIAGVAIPSGGGNTWYVFLNSSTSGVGTVLQNYDAASGITVTATSTGASDETPKYLPDGRLLMDSTTQTTGITFTFTAEGSTDTRTLTIGPSGFPSVSNP